MFISSCFTLLLIKKQNKKIGKQNVKIKEGRRKIGHAGNGKRKAILNAMLKLERNRATVAVKAGKEE